MKSRKTILLTSLVLAAAIIAVAVKMVSSRSVKDSYFLFDTQKLEQVPTNLVVLRSTQYPGSFQKGVLTGNNSAARMLGRDATFVQIVSAAYGIRPSRVVLPPDTPKGNFDFLVTSGTNSDAQLQAAIKKGLGYTARKETRDSSVFFLKVVSPDLPGMNISPDAEKADINFKNGIVYFTHQKAGLLARPVEWFLKTPVIDQTGLTNFYDYSYDWDWRMGSGSMTEATTKRMLTRMGLGIEPGTAPVEMLIVKKTN